MINSITFTGGIQRQVQEFFTDAAHEYLPTGKIFDASEVAKQTAKTVAEEVPFFNHRGNNVIDTAAAKLQELAAAESYVKSHGGQVVEDAAKASLKTNA